MPGATLTKSDGENFEGNVKVKLGPVSMTYGGTARFVYLPHESHGYAARESIETTLAETIEWFDRHVKNAPETR